MNLATKVLIQVKIAYRDSYNRPGRNSVFENFFIFRKKTLNNIMSRAIRSRYPLLKTIKVATSENL